MMASSQQFLRVHKEVFLKICEHCDLGTLSRIMQTSSVAYGLVKTYERSIAKAKLAACHNPPIGCLLSSKDEERKVIPVLESVATVREVERRENRVNSLVNPGGFMLLDDFRTLGFPCNESLERFRAGLRHALEVTDHIADLAADPSLEGFYQEDIPNSVSSRIPLLNDGITGNNTQGDDVQAGFFAQYSADLQAFYARYPQRMEQSRALRNLQVKYIRSLSCHDLIWLITLTQGASLGYARWSAKVLDTDTSMAQACVMAFQEVLLRMGSLFLDGFIRGRGSLHLFVEKSIRETAKEVMFFEEGGTGLPDGLHMTILGELGTRVVAKIQKVVEEQNGVVDAENIYPGIVGQILNAMVAMEVGWDQWKGYPAVEHPYSE